MTPADEWRIAGWLAVLLFTAGAFLGYERYCRWRENLPYDRVMIEDQL